MTNTVHLAVTGHRPNKLGGYDIDQHEGYNQLKQLFIHAIEFYVKQGLNVTGHTGMALGADTVWGLAILDMKEKYPGRVHLHAEIPFLSQPNVWFNQQDKDRWQLLYDNADERTVYDPTFESFNEAVRKRKAGKVLNERNQGMVNNCDRLIAVYDGVSTVNSGTYNTIQYAISMDKPVSVIKSQEIFK